jgi:hypothetical protein
MSIIGNSVSRVLCTLGPLALLLAACATAPSNGVRLATQPDPCESRPGVQVECSARGIGVALDRYTTSRGKDRR